MRESTGCEAIREDTKAFLDGELPMGRRMAVLRHLAACPSCRKEADAMKQFSETLRYQDRTAEGDRLDPALRARILAALPDSPPPSPRRSPLALLQRKPMLAYGTAMTLLIVWVVFRPMLMQAPRIPDFSTRNMPASSAGPSAAGAKASQEDNESLRNPVADLSKKKAIQPSTKAQHIPEGARARTDVEQKPPVAFDAPAAPRSAAVVAPIPEAAKTGPTDPVASARPVSPTFRLKSETDLRMNRGLSVEAPTAARVPSTQLEEKETTVKQSTGRVFGRAENVPSAPRGMGTSALAASSGDVYLMLKDRTITAPNADRKAKAAPAELGVVVSNLEQSRDKLTRIVEEAGGTVEPLQQQNSTYALNTVKESIEKSAYFALKIPAAQQEKVIQQVAEMRRSNQLANQGTVDLLANAPRPNTAFGGMGRAVTPQKGVLNSGTYDRSSGAARTQYDGFRGGQSVGGPGGGLGGGLGGGNLGQTGQAGQPGQPGQTNSGPVYQGQRPAGGGGFAGGGGGRRSSNRDSKADSDVAKDKTADQFHEQMTNQNRSRYGGQFTAPGEQSRNNANIQGKRLELQSAQQAKKRNGLALEDFSTLVVHLSEQVEKNEKSDNGQNAKKPSPAVPGSRKK